MWNRTYQKAVDLAAAGPAEDLCEDRAVQEGGVMVDGGAASSSSRPHVGKLVAVQHLSDLAECDVVCFCLPTLQEVRESCLKLAPLLKKKDVVFVDHTSGEWHMRA